MEKRAILVGGSGSIGSSLLLQLLASKQYASVLVLARRELRLQHPKLKQLTIDFHQLNNYASEIKGDAVFCCLGTTKSQTPELQAYREVDYQYPIDVAWIAQTNGVESFHLVSSMGANKNSKAFYLRTKGELERDLKAIPFKSLHIYRPFLLDGPRQRKRILESFLNALMYLINPFLIGALKRFRSIKVETVAAAMIKQSLTDEKGIFIYESDQIQKLGIENEIR